MPANRNIGVRIKNLRDAKSLPRAAVASAAGLSYDYLAKIENNQRHPNVAVLERIASALGVSIAELLSDIPAPARSPEIFPLGEGVPIPRIGWAQAGSFAEASDMNFQPGDADEWVYSSRGGRRVFALRVEGDSMSPEFSAGEVIVVDPDREPSPGDFVIAKEDDDNVATFKQLRYMESGAVLHPLNRAYSDIPLNAERPARIVGVVIEKKTVIGDRDRKRAILDAIVERLEPLDERDMERVSRVIDAFLAK